MDTGKYGGHIVFLSVVCSRISYSQGNMFSVSSAFVNKFQTEAPKYWFSYVEAFLAIVLDKRQLLKTKSSSERLTEKFMYLKDKSLGFVKTSYMSGGTLYLQQHTFRAQLMEYW